MPARCRASVGSRSSVPLRCETLGARRRNGPTRRHGPSVLVAPHPRRRCLPRRPGARPYVPPSERISCRGCRFREVWLPRSKPPPRPRQAVLRRKHRFVQASKVASTDDRPGGGIRWPARLVLASSSPSAGGWFHAISLGGAPCARRWCGLEVGLLVRCVGERLVERHRLCLAPTFGRTPARRAQSGGGRCVGRGRARPRPRTFRRQWIRERRLPLRRGERRGDRDPGRQRAWRRSRGLFAAR